MDKRLPGWFKQKLPKEGETTDVTSVLVDLKLNTVCQSALCPNIYQCFAKKTATFMIMGDICTRNCNFCAIKKGDPSPLSTDEPQRIATAIKRLGLEYTVITSVTRDDLADGGASHFARTIEAIHTECPFAKIEVLVPDFQGLTSALEMVIDTNPCVLNHNIETIPELYPQARPLASYQRSLDLLRNVKSLNPKIITKSGLMLGLGETYEQVIEVMEDLRKAKCDLITIGQYLSPSNSHNPVASYITPDEFSSYIKPALEMGFSGIAAAPLVRSSYKAAELYKQAYFSHRAI